jgi:hypothetical protein
MILLSSVSGRQGPPRGSIRAAMRAGSQLARNEIASPIAKMNA